MEQIVQFVNEHLGLLLSVIAVLLGAVALRDYGTLKDIAGGVFLDIEKRVTDAAVLAGPEKLSLAVQAIINQVPGRFTVVLRVLAFLLGVESDQLARKIAQVLYDRIRQHKVRVETHG